MQKGLTTFRFSALSSANSISSRSLRFGTSDTSYATGMPSWWWLMVTLAEKVSMRSRYQCQASSTSPRAIATGKNSTPRSQPYAREFCRANLNPFISRPAGDDNGHSINCSIAAAVVLGMVFRKSSPILRGIHDILPVSLASQETIGARIPCGKERLTRNMYDAMHLSQPQECM